MTDLLKQEYARSLEKHPPEEWATMQPTEMIEALLAECDELKTALWCADMDGPHGILVESAHVQIVARRIVEECQRRENETNTQT